MRIQSRGLNRKSCDDQRESCGMGWVQSSIKPLIQTLTMNEITKKSFYVLLLFTGKVGRCDQGKTGITSYVIYCLIITMKYRFWNTSYEPICMCFFILLVDLFSHSIDIFLYALNALMLFSDDLHVNFQLCYRNYSRWLSINKVFFLIFI